MNLYCYADSLNSVAPPLAFTAREWMRDYIATDVQPGTIYPDDPPRFELKLAKAAFRANVADGTIVPFVAHAPTALHAPPTRGGLFHGLVASVATVGALMRSLYSAFLNSRCEHRGCLRRSTLCEYGDGWQAYFCWSHRTPEMWPAQRPY